MSLRTYQPKKRQRAKVHGFQCLEWLLKMVEKF